MNPESWRLARLIVRDGGLVAFPTDTVYGVGCDPFNVQAIEKLYAAKGRDREKAIPLLLASVERCANVTLSMRIPPCAARLGGAFWPGALTLVVQRAHHVPVELGGGDTIAVRVPDHPELQAFIGACGGALAASSANLSGKPDARTAMQVAEYLGDSVQLVIDGGPSPGGVPSTVVNCVVEPPAILREGAIVRERIVQALAVGE